MINVNSPIFNKQLRREKTPDGMYEYNLSHEAIAELLSGPIRNMSYEQLNLLKMNYLPNNQKHNTLSKNKPNLLTNESNNNKNIKPMKITIKESELRIIVENKIRKVLKEETNFNQTRKFNDALVPFENFESASRNLMALGYTPRDLFKIILELHN